MTVLRMLQELIVNLLPSRLGYRCPDCGVRPLKDHKDDCPTGKWDGGIWA